MSKGPLPACSYRGRTPGDEQMGPIKKSGWGGRDAWGPLHDSRSRLGKLRLRIHHELVEEFGAAGPLPASHLRTLEEAADLRAVATKTLQGVGIDERCTAQRALKLLRAVEQLLGPLRSAGKKPDRKVPSLAEIKNRYRDAGPT
jgi:hypothetical protein